MARPRKEETPLTEQVQAPVTETVAYVPPPPPPPAPRQKRIERQGGQTVPYSRRYPQVRGGICEYCGVLSPTVESKYQYKLCPHYRGMQLQCSYCPDSKDPDNVIYTATLNVAEHPSNPDSLVVWCDSYECSKAHIERFKVSA